VFHLILAMTVFWWYGTHTAQVQVQSFACKGRIRNLEADCSTIGLNFVTITWQQIF